MTERDRLERINALEHQLQMLRPKLTAALQAMDYELALTCQIKIDDLQAELNAHQPHKDHIRLMTKERGDYYAA
jgi:hypothetical protein